MTAVCSYVEYMANEWVRLINRVRGTGSICLIFSYIVCATNRRQILSCTEPANEVNKTFIIRLLVHFYLCSSSDVAVYLTFELVGVASCLHSLGIHLPRL